MGRYCFFRGQWRYLDNGSDQQTAWQQPGFDDAAWSVGNAPLGYGDGDEATVVSFGSNASAKYTTTYFRHQFSITSVPTNPVTLGVQRDDGVVVYLNGVEVMRDNMPSGAIASTTFALSAVSGSGESVLQTSSIDPALLVIGTNTLAVEIHQANLGSSDISFDLRLSDSALIRGPYLQQATDNGVTVRWRTSVSRDAVVRYGTDSTNLNLQIGDATVGTDHAVSIDGLTPDTRYYYSVGDGNGSFLSGTEQYFETHPTPGSNKPTRIWVLGDSGTANANAAAVRDAYVGFNGGTHADVWLMLGDNAYNDGTDAQYQSAVFDMYPSILQNSVLWSTLGNHDGYTADSATQSGPYYDIFSFPTNAESGGVASSTEAYYSFDYGNIHFITLDSYETNRSSSGAMATWLVNDLAATTQDWIIAFWHHPPYTKGSHDSDTEARLVDMRETFLPILDSYGVDLVLGGHSHSYERSMLIDGHYGSSSTFDSVHIVDGSDGDPLGSGAYQKSSNSNSGAVYSVAGSSGKISSAPLDHPVMLTNLIELGSMVIDVDGNQLDAVFLNDDGVIRDRFSIVHETSNTTPPAAPSALAATVVSASEIQLAWTDNADNEDSFSIERSIDQNNWSIVAQTGSNSTGLTDTNLEAETLYFYRAKAVNAIGSSAYSNVANATTDSLPSFIDYLAASNTTLTGTINGGLTATHSDDGTTQTITETESGGKKSRRYSYLEHRWSFSVAAGASATVYANTWASASSDGDEFQFSYSVNGGASWQHLFTVSSINPSNTETAVLPAGINGTVIIRVIDTDRTQGNRSLDSISVDELGIRVGTAAGSPPDAPSGLSGTVLSPTSVSLQWTDNSSDELGFTVERIDASASWTAIANVGVDAQSYSDGSVAPGNTYQYRVSAYNASGSSANSNTISIELEPAQGISLSALGRKVKGRIYSDLSWSDTGAVNVEIIRDGNSIFTENHASDSGDSFTDETGVKGSASFVYQACTITEPIECSNEATVAF